MKFLNKVHTKDLVIGLKKTYNYGSIRLFINVFMGFCNGLFNN